MTELPTFSWEEVGRHSTEDDLWLVINGFVYDVSKYALEHPGGPLVLGGRAGRSASQAFEQANHSPNAITNVLPKWRIGKIKADSQPQQWQREASQQLPLVGVVLALVLVIGLLLYVLAG